MAGIFIADSRSEEISQAVEFRAAQNFGERQLSSGIGVVSIAMLSPGRVSLSHAVHCLVAAVLLLLGALAVAQPSRYLFLFTSKNTVYFICFAGIILLYLLLREDRA
jgi:hypothetical protein